MYVFLLFDMVNVKYNDLVVSTCLHLICNVGGYSESASWLFYLLNCLTTKYSPILRPRFLRTGFITFSINTCAKTVSGHPLQYCLLVSDAHWDMKNLWKIWFCVVSNLGMQVARWFYVLTTYQYFRSDWYANWSSYMQGYTNYSYRDWEVAICE